MNPNPQSSKVKIAYTGTNCSGKTTAALDTTVRLKMAGVLADVFESAAFVTLFAACATTAAECV